jgi:alkylated DNA repair dioxygenase AlkB
MLRPQAKNRVAARFPRAGSSRPRPEHSAEARVDPLPGRALVPSHVDLSVPSASFQPDLFASIAAPGTDGSFATLERVWLEEGAWVDHAPGWVKGSDTLFEQVLRTRDWGQRTRWMYERRVLEPRLTSHWRANSGEPLEPPPLEEMRLLLSARYGVVFDSVGFNLYRDGHDSVAWHSDKILKEIVDPVIALVSLGEPRRFLIRPKAGGSSRTFLLGRGDLLVTGGKTQRSHQHCVPKVTRAGARISLAFRYGLDPRAYGHKTTHPVP